MDRRPLTLLLALGLAGTLPAGATAATADALFAQTPSGTLSDTPADAAVAQTPSGTLSDTPAEAGGSDSSSSGSSSSGSSKSSGSKTTATATADALPFTGSDPRITLLLGMAALLGGLGLRMKSAHPHDY